MILRILAAYVPGFAAVAALMAVAAALLGGLVPWPYNAYLAAVLGTFLTVPIYRLIWG